MPPLVRSIIATLVGVVVAFVLITGMEAVSTRVYPLPAGVDTTDAESLRASMSTIPTGALVLVLLGWTIGSFVGGLAAARLAPSNPERHALIVGGLLLIAGIANMLMIPHPVWFWIASLLMFVPAAYAGAKMSGRGRAAPLA